MNAFADLLTAIAALERAVAGPAAFVSVICAFRKELQSALGRVPFVLDRVTKASLAGIALDLDRVANAEIERGADKAGNVTPRQKEAAARIAIETRDISSQALLSELDR